MVTIADELPRGLTKVSATGGSCALLPPVAAGALDAPESGTVQCGTALLPEGASITITITPTLVAGFTGTPENIARATRSRRIRT